MSDSATFAPAAKIHLADRPPVACASCNGQYTDRAHVDFSAGYEGATLPPEAQQHIAGAKHAHVDDLIICDECLKAAAAVIGYGDLTAATEAGEAAAAQIEELSERLAGAVTYISTLEAAGEQRGKLEDALKPKPRRRGGSA